MRIIIIGEFSSFSKNLSEGFRAIGHECYVFSWGDSFKNIEQESGLSYSVHLRTSSQESLYDHIANGFASFISSIKLKSHVRYMSSKDKWDAALVINQSFIKQRGKFWSPVFTIKMIQNLLYNPNNIYLSACGRDIPYCDYWGGRINKNSELVKLLSSGFFNKKMIRHHEMCMKTINKVIPVMYDYSEAWRKSQFGKGCILCKTIPLPISCDKYIYHNNLSDKLFIFHGITRPNHKGTSFILEAMNELARKYPDKVICEVRGGLPLNQYLEIMDKANVLIDQTYSYGFGMNALYGLARGKIVLSGNENENQMEYGSICPIVNIKPEVNQIFIQLEKLILSVDIKTLSKESREYAEQYHDSKIIAHKYIDTFKKYNI